ncbi:MAG: lysophospholipid acyltransferase family protein [Planctomycetota bacterium]|nr:lysophospholipid acyltransferase family protein [Planctomycetota bacterium]
MSEDGGGRARFFGQPLFYEVCRWIFLVVATVWLGYRRWGMENVPKEGGVLLVANHQSYVDPPLIGLCAHDRQFHPMAREGLFRVKWLSPIIRALNAFAVNEKGGDAKAMKEAIRLLHEGKVVLIFPEGSRTHDGHVSEFKRGAALLVKKAECPVVPVAIEGAFEAWPRGKRAWIGGNRVGVEVGRAIAHEELMQDGADAALRRLEREVEALRVRLRGRLDAAGGRARSDQAIVASPRA